MNDYLDNDADYEDCEHNNIESFEETYLTEDGSETIVHYWRCTDCGMEWHS